MVFVTSATRVSLPPATEYNVNFIVTVSADPVADVVIL